VKRAAAAINFHVTLKNAVTRSVLNAASFNGTSRHRISIEPSLYSNGYIALAFNKI